MILTCNTLPNVPSDDGGTWRRIRVVEFTSKFCENPDPLKPCEFKADYELSEKFPVWKEHFMSLLILYYKKYVQTGIVEPDEVLECTKEYQKNNDTFLEFFEQEFEKHEGSYITYTEISSAFKLWCKENNVHVTASKKTDFIKTVSKTLGKNGMLGKTEIWKGWRFKNIEEDNDDL
jgi:phage/plasmid-associated DNA primase